MAAASAPWLDGLDDDLHDEWDAQPSASDAETHEPLADITWSQDTSSRKGLVQLDSNTQNARAGANSIRSSAPKGTVKSIESVVRYDTVERQVSPTRKEADMQWKTRLVDGELGYGDHTDLFGPTALENIFQSPPKPISALKEQSDAIPSSPPPWPASMPFKARANVIFPSLSENGQDYQEVDLHTQEHGSDPINNSDLDQSAEFADDSQVVNSRQDDTAFTDRKVSGQTEIGNETFSPVFISKHTTMDGEINYTPLDSDTAKMLQTSTTSTAQTAQKIPISITAESAETDSVIEESKCQIEVTLPDNLPTGTPPVATLGKNVTFHRGGLSDCGSFKIRPLSPSAAGSRKPSVTFKPIQAEDVFDAYEEPTNTSPIRHDTELRSNPHTPTRQSPTREHLTPGSSGSPLKLFGAYDTFTNKKLMRRLSQLEGSDDKANAIEHQEEVSIEDAEEDVAQEDFSGDISANSEVKAKLDTFEEPEDDAYDFEADLSFPSDDSQETNKSDEYDDRSRSGSPEPGVNPPGAMSPFMFHVEDCDDQQETFGIKRKMSDHSTNKSRRPDCSPTGAHDERTKAIADMDSQWRGSPTKLPTPKRQRTLHHLDLEMERLAIEDQDEQAISSSPTPSQREEALSSSPEREWRPRNPTPGQSDRQKAEDSQIEFMSSSPRLRAIQDMIEESSLPGSMKLVSQAKAVASEVAAFTLNVTKHDDDAGERKRSITTQDFLNEAMHIMSLIRARGRPSGLGSVEESNEESIIAEEPSELPSVMSPSVLRVSRPPSREGAVSGWRPRSQPNQNPQLEDQLNRFREKDDMEILDATIHSLKLKGVADEQYSEHSDGSVGSIRITGPLQHVQEEEDFYSDPFQVHGERPDSIDSQGSANYSTGRTQGSGSDKVAHLAPETVAHLIPEEIAGMTFDGTHGRWVRTKPRSEMPSRLSHYNPASHIGSDDDPFNNIPDLTVDELEEMERVQTSQVSRSGPSQTMMDQHIECSDPIEDPVEETSTVRPDTGHSRATFLQSSTAPTYPMRDSTMQHISTRATSWATDYRNQINKHSAKDSKVDLEPLQHVELPTVKPATASRGDLQAFSSEAHHKVDEQDSDVEELPARQSFQPGRKVSFQAHAFRQRRFAPDADQSELSIVAELPDKRVMSVSVAVSKPVGLGPEDSQVAIHEHPNDSSSLILSDLPEFTVAEIDHSPGRTERRLAATVALHGQEIEGDRYALAVQDLVKTLTDLKGEEPYWEDIKHLNLHGRSLNSLHGLEKFCSRLQGLDVSTNGLSHLEGAPWAMRWLKVSHNNLSSLTAWNSLVNLQYLDISHNNVTSLDGLGCLVHLRELKADHNNITSLAGLRDLDGLLSVNVAHNEISCVDLSAKNWTRLEKLDLSDNNISEMPSLCGVPALKELSVDNNDISNLCLKSEADSNLQSLSASNNSIQSLDLTPVPALRYLDLDGNSISSLPGLSSLQNLDVLSLRSQSVSSSIWDVIFLHPVQARKIYLSSNTLPPTLPLYATQNTVSTLELSTCGILNLPTAFGLHFPNLANLNLNFNALKDIRPVLNMDHLSTLHVAGNRLGRLRKCAETLSHVKKLSSVDLRENPFTLGFYPALGTEAQLVRCGEPDEEQQSKDKAYLLPDQDSETTHPVDEDTRLRKRVYEILLVNGCKGLTRLDGRAVDRSTSLRRDDAWTRLKELGVLKKTSA